MFDLDYLCWDSTEAVVYESARHSLTAAPDPDPLLLRGPPVPAYDAAAAVNANDVIPVALAKRRNLTVRELAASGGAYTGQDRVWLVPAPLLPRGFACKPADVVIDGDGNRWTALEVGLGKFGQTWRLTCRDLVLAFALYDLVQIERASVSYDAAGAAVKTYPPGGGEVLYKKLPARVQLLTQEVKDERGFRGFLGTYAVIVGRQVAVTAEDRVKLADGRYLDIKGAHNPNLITELPVLDCELRP